MVTDGKFFVNVIMTTVLREDPLTFQGQDVQEDISFMLMELVRMGMQSDGSFIPSRRDGGRWW